jgi:hypothetical protein
MKIQPNPRQLFIDMAALWLATVLVVAPVTASAQNSGDLVPRDMQDSQLFRNRPPAKRAGRRPNRRYVRTGAPAPASEKAKPAGIEIGVTVWRLRPSLPGDPRDIVHEPSADSVALTPVRLTSEQELVVGERFRFGIESSREGYLYVVNRPLYDGGPPRDPYLIFPTRRIRGGENAMTTGQIVELPTPFDSPPQFTITQRGEGHLIAEEVIVLVTPKPLELEIGPGPLRLTNQTLEEWERRWGGPVERFEYENGAGMLYTIEEKSARDDARYRMRRDGPAPQVLFRIPDGYPKPVFLRVKIKVRADKSSAMLSQTAERVVSASAPRAFDTAPRMPVVATRKPRSRSESRR